MITFLMILLLNGHSLPEWEHVGPAGTGYGITSIVQSHVDPQELFCVGGCSVPGWWDYGNYIYHSENGGESWSACRAPDMNTIAGALLGYTPGGTLLILGNSDNGIFYTQDNGENWSYANLPSDPAIISRIVTVSDEPEMVWMVGSTDSKSGIDAQHGAVWITTDSGQNWSSNDILTTPAHAYDIAVATTDTQILCVAGESSSAALLMKSETGAASWNDITPPQCSSHNAGAGVAIHPEDSDLIIFSTEEGIYRSSDGGTLWAAVSSIENVSLISFSTVNPDYVVACADNAVVMSTDAGLTWESVYTLPAGEQPLQVSPSLFAATDIFAATPEGCLVSDDSGSSWSLSNDGLSFSSTYSLTNAQGSSSRMYMLLNGEFSLSDDLGFSWTACTTPDGMHPYYTELCRNPMDANNVIATGSQSEIFTTHDAGSTWQSSSGQFGTAFCAIADPSEDGVFYIGGSSPQAPEHMRIAKSEDSGITWSFSDLGDSGARIYSICVDPSKPDTLYAGGSYHNYTGHILMRSYDSGVSWNEVQTTIPAGYSLNSISVSPFNSSLILAAIQDGIYRSDDFGVSWSKVTDASSTRFVTFDPFDSDRAWMWNSWYPLLGVSVSLDAGVTWEECNQGLPFWKVVMSISFADPDMVYLSTVGSLFRMDLTTEAIGETSFLVPESGTLIVSPNPVVSSASVSYTAQTMSLVQFTLFDVTGRVVKQESVLPEETGRNTFQWSIAGELPGNGIYFLRMNNGSETATARMVLCKE